ncbi:hypothetical protein [Halalkalibacter okhensis]|uniref:Adhesin domain-containing protein n=1 Tax=Halalkalibacter okhensis TaxID=333138 RepID=A0A0B0IGS4_9BACI|nr:hypothetical protein [Halalkalibacter okhensis]KHF41788.1 hypothetical protein LQ50_00335 [Halalkalibacter okhensis]
MNKIVSAGLLVLAIFVMTGCNIVTYENEEIFTLDSEGLEALVIDQDEGDVTITGVEGLEQIQVTATFAAMSDQDIEQAKRFSENNTSLVLEAREGNGELRTSVKRGTDIEQGFVHLEIEVPDHLPLAYRQNEGQLKILSMKSDIKLQHGSNNLTLQDIEGDVEITDGAGHVTLENVRGAISINNNAGTTNISGSSGQLKLIAGSGHVDFQDHIGDVLIRSGSGNINIVGVNGDVEILESRGGAVNIEDVTGTITQP